MKTSATVLVLLALLTLAPCAQSSAQTLPAAAPSVASAPAMAMAAPVPAETADFLATLSAARSGASNDLAPAPSFMTGCTSNAQCPTGQLCCYPCGIDGCTNMCITPIKGHCPHFP